VYGCCVVLVGTYLRMCACSLSSTLSSDLEQRNGGGALEFVKNNKIKLAIYRHKTVLTSLEQQTSHSIKS
jgi:hypothetical protein